MKKFAKWLVMILVVSCICALTLFATGCGSKDKSVKSITVNDKGEIVAVYDDDSSATLGTVGLVKSGEMKDGKFVLTLTDGKTITCDMVATANTVVSIKTVDGAFELTYGDGHTEKIDLGKDLTCKHENATYIEQVAHEMSADGKSFTNGIYLELCPDCGYAYTFVGVRHELKETVVDPTCLAEGYTTEKCTVCGLEGEKKDETKALGHNFEVRPVLSATAEEAKKWCEEGGLSIEVCSRCNELGKYTTIAKEDAHGHHADNWTVTKEPTWNSVGILSGTCNVCGNVIDDKTIPACSDDAYVVSDVTPEGASCSAETKGTFTIEVDGQKIVAKDVVIPGVQHTFKGEKVNDKETKVFTDKAAFDASGLKLMGNTPALTCSTTSQAYFTCDECGEIIAISVRKRHASTDSTKDHVKVDGTGKEWYATCEHDGILIIDCATCKAEKEEVIPAVGHDYVYTWDKDAEKLIGVCQNVANEKVKTCENDVDVIGDLKKVETEVVKAATCKEAGLTKYTLTKKDNTVIVKNAVTPKHDHSLTRTDGSVVSISDATGKRYSVSDYPEITPFGNAVVSCAADFGGGFTCAECKEYIAVALYKAHTIKEGTLTKHPATCTTPGTRDYTCTVCGDDKPIVDEKYEDALGHDYAWTSVDKEGSADGKYHLVGICQRELTDGAGKTEICGDKKDYSSAKPFEANVILEPTCAREGQTNYTIVNDDGTTSTLKVVVSKLNHTLNGKKINDREPVSSTTKGVSFFGNSDTKLACDGNGVPGYFKCDDCGQIISINVKKDHTRPTADKIEVDPASCDHYGTETYTCEDCKNPVVEIIEPLGHSLKATAEYINGNIVVTITCDRKFNVGTEEERACDAQFGKKTISNVKFTEKEYNFKVLVDDKATCAHDGLKKYSFELKDYTYTVTNGKVVDGKAQDVAGTKKVTLECTVQFVTDKLDHAYVQTAQLDKDGNVVLDKDGKPVMVDKVFTFEIVEGEGDDAKTYIVPVYICKDCGKVVEAGEKYLKPADDTTSD